MRVWTALIMLAALLTGGCRAPVGGPAFPGPDSPGMERPVQIYFASARPVLRAPDRLEMVFSMGDLKGQAGESPRAIWLDAGVAGQVEVAWLREKYRAGWPVFVFGEGAHGTLLKLLEEPGEEPQPGLGAYRKVGKARGVWTQLPPVEELLKLSRELLSP